MTEKIFAPGQQVCCIDDSCIAVNPAQQNIPDVFYGNNYTIKKYEHFKYGLWWVSLVGFADGLLYSEDSFVPLVEISEVIELFNHELV